MPSGPPELHRYWCDKDPGGNGDWAAQAHLRARGYVLTRRWDWWIPFGRELSDEDESAIRYLMLEWDFGGAVREEDIRARALAEALKTKPDDAQSLVARAMMLAEPMRGLISDAVLLPPARKETER